MQKIYTWIIFSLLLSILNCYTPLLSPTSMDEVPESQRENLKIENGYAIIEMKKDGDLKEYNASFLLNQSESLKFFFNLTYSDDIKNTVNLTLSSENISRTIPLAYEAASVVTQIIFYLDREIIGSFADSNLMAFNLTDGILKNNGSDAKPKPISFYDDGIQEDGKRHIDFILSWKNKVDGEFIIPLDQFAVPAPPTTTTSTSTTTSTTTTKRPLIHKSKSTTPKPEVKNAGPSESTVWIAGLSLFAIAYLIVIGVAGYCYYSKTKKRKSITKTSDSPVTVLPTKTTGTSLSTTQIPPQSTPMPKSDTTQQTSTTITKTNPPQNKSVQPSPLKPSTAPQMKAVEPPPAPPITPQIAPQPPSQPQKIDSKEIGKPGENYVEFNKVGENEKK